MKEFSLTDNPVVQFVDDHRLLSAAVGMAAVAGSVWAGRGMLTGVAAAEEVAAPAEKSGIVSLGGELHREDLARLLNSVAHPIIPQEPEDAAFAQMMALAARHDDAFVRILKPDSIGFGGPNSPRFERAVKTVQKRIGDLFTDRKV